jgi:hypothetical protein
MGNRGEDFREQLQIMSMGFHSEISDLRSQCAAELGQGTARLEGQTQEVQALTESGVHFRDLTRNEFRVLEAAASEQRG